MYLDKTTIKRTVIAQSCITINEDNQACIALTKNPEDHNRTKHIQMRYHAIRDYVERKEITFIILSVFFSFSHFDGYACHRFIERDERERFSNKDTRI